MSDRWFGEHFREVVAMLQRTRTNEPQEKVEVLPLRIAAKAFLEKFDTCSSREAKECDKELEALRLAVETEEKAVQKFREQFTGSGGTMQSDPNVKYEVWN